MARLRVMNLPTVPGPEGLSFRGETHQQRGRRPALAVFRLELDNPVVDPLEAYRIGPKHRPSAIGREAVAGQINDVDIDSSQRRAVFQYTSAFVDQTVQAAFQDFLAGEGS